MIRLIFCVALFMTDDATTPYHEQCVEISTPSRSTFLAAMLESIKPFESYEVVSHSTDPGVLILEVVPKWSTY